MAKPRALGVIRLSKLTDETTSPARQRELIEQKAAARDAVIVGWAQDDDISASKYHPMKRPALRKWLDRPEEYDEIIFWRADRFVRKVRDLADMIDWSRKHRKGLVSATESFDLDDPTGQGEAMAVLATLFAQMETRATSIRVTGAQAYLRRSGRWQGNNFAYGYKPVSNPTGPGLILVPDEYSAAILHEAVERVVNGESVQAVARSATTGQHARHATARDTGNAARNGSGVRLPECCAMRRCWAVSCMTVKQYSAATACRWSGQNH
jgi:site-specific DNA recombinase